MLIGGYHGKNREIQKAGDGETYAKAERQTHA
jgi:hypothetical protein